MILLEAKVRIIKNPRENKHFELSRKPKRAHREPKGAPESLLSSPRELKGSPRDPQRDS